MNIDIKIRYRGIDSDEDICFSCAVTLALKGTRVKTITDDFDSEYYMSSSFCQSCHSLF